MRWNVRKNNGCYAVILVYFVSTKVWANPFQLPEPLTNSVPNVQRGLDTITDSDKASCLLCHRIGQLNDRFQGNIGPDLSSVGLTLSAAELRFRLLFPQKINPASPMPSYGVVTNNRQVGDQYSDKTVYSAQEIEDVIAYLLTLRGEYEVE